MPVFFITFLFQAVLLLFFIFFAFYNYRYQIAGMFTPQIKKATPANTAKVAVVIVCRNEKLVIHDTIRACEALTYPNKTIIVGDDSDDLETTSILRNIAQKYHCRQVINTCDTGGYESLQMDEAYESEQFVVLHRKNNVGYKAGNIKVIEGYLKARGFEYMYLLDADWHPEPEAIEKCLEVLEADPGTAFVQTRRDSYYGPRDHFRRCLAMMEESCYYVDLAGRQVLGDMILFTGCCALFRLSHLNEVGGFMPGHLTEDIDLSNRLYLAGYKGVYLGDVGNIGEVPPNYKAYRKQQDRWTRGSAKVLKDYFRSLLTSKKINSKTKLSMLRQNAYFTVAVGTEISIILSIVALFFSTVGSYPVSKTLLPNDAKTMLYFAIPLTYLIFFSSLFYLIILTIKKREWLNLLYIPFVWWINLSIIHTYFIANIIGLKRGDNSWFLTPKTNRARQKIYIQGDWRMNAINLISLILMIITSYIAITTQKETAALVIPYAAGWIPAFLIGTIKS